MISDIPNLINVPKEVLIQDYFYPPWMWTHLNDDTLPDTNNYNADALSIILFTARH